jgi:CBS domain-containing protein
MTRDVVTVGPYTAVPDIAAIMADKHISGVPVVTDSGEIIGIVSESDLLRRVEIGTEREIRRKWWLGNLADVNTLAREYAKAHGLRAQDVMSRYVISVRASAELRDVADILDRHRIKRLPVLQAGRLVGIITRGDLVRALSQVRISKSVKRVDNAVLHKALHERIRAQPWINESCISVTVDDGVVELRGFVDTVDQHSALRALVEETVGVGRVEDKICVGNPLKAGKTAKSTAP